MWNQRIDITKDKSITQLELLVLAVIDSNDTITPTQVIHRIASSFSNYNPQRGTIYPILHRLTDDEYLKLSETGKKSFSRTKLGSHALLLSIETILDSFENIVEYFKIITESTVSEDPEGAKDIVNRLMTNLLQLHTDLKQFENTLDEKIKEDWYDVPVL